MARDVDPTDKLKAEASQRYVKDEEVAPPGPKRAHKQKGQATGADEQGGGRKEDMNENRPSERH